MNSFIKNNFFKNNYGLALYFSKLFIQRLELSLLNKNIKFNPVQKLLYDFYVVSFKFNNHTFKTRNLINIYLLNLLCTYKGWRHSRGLPVRGQRTWSNGWSSYRANTILRSYKIIISKKIYGQNFSNDYFVAYLAEEVNNMWRLQWGHEWLEARRKRLNSSKNIKNLPKIDLLSMSKLQVGSFGKKEKTKKKKQTKNSLTLGFDPGFTKLLVKNNLVTDSKKSK